PTTVTRPGLIMVAPVALLALLSLAVGVGAPAVDRLLAAYADQFPSTAPPYQLALWHGLTPALLLSLVVLAAGAALFWAGHRGRSLAIRLPVDGTTVYERVMSVVDRLAVGVTGATQRGSLPFYLVVILLVLVALPGMALLLSAPWPRSARAWDTPLQAVVGVLIIIAAIWAARARRRLTAMLLVGGAGYGMGVPFTMHGASDCYLSQFTTVEVA